MASSSSKKKKGKGSRSMSSKEGEGSRSMSTQKAEAISVKIVYVESDFVCSSPIIEGDLSATLKAAAAHGVQEAATELRLPKKLLHARPIGPLQKEDGSPFSVEEWAKRYFVVVEAKPDKGLAARCKVQEVIMAQHIEDVSVPAGKVTLDSELQQENEALKKENSELKLRVFNLQEEQKKLKNDLSGTQLQLKVSKLEEEKASALSLAEAAKAEKETLEAENKDLKERVAALEKEVADLKGRVETLEKKFDDVKKECDDLKVQMSKLSVWEKVMVRKMLDQCRQKCKEIFATASLEVPADWNLVCEDPTLMAVLEANGLSIGLMSTKYGLHTMQHEGSRAAHEMTEGIDLYASTVCKMTGVKRDRLLNVFEFVFGVSAESIEFEDDLDDV